MPDEKFLEDYPLYKKFGYLIPPQLNDIPKVNINMYCEVCKDIRTFNLTHSIKNIFYDLIPSLWHRNYWDSIDAKFIILSYLCASCKGFFRFFFIEIDPQLNYFMKIGQFPAWEISIPKDIQKILKDYSIFYRKGLINENNGNGIGAYAYYRRIIEGIIVKLLNLIPDLMSGDERETYEKALENIKLKKNVSDKIKIVMDLIPPILKPNNEFNPLKILYDILSKGLHEKSEEECLEDAESIRTCMIFLIETILKQQKEKQEFTEKMRKLLKKTDKK